MPNIKFSHNYYKLHYQNTATLLDVRELYFPEDKNKELVKYDTGFYGEYGDDYLFLPDGPYIQLVFIGNKNIPFCTLRKNDEEGKKEYYESMVGKEFKIIIKGVTF